MLRWITNSKGSITNKTSKFKGIGITNNNRFKAIVTVRANGVYKDTKSINIYIGTYDTLNEAKTARINYILNLL